MSSDDSTSKGAGEARPAWLTHEVNLRSLLTWKAARRMLVVAAVAFVAIQFVPVDRSNPPIETEAPASAEVRAVLHRACGDCHTNETVWPWYSKVAPVSWLVASDVHDGRSRMNLSTWNRYDAQQQDHKRARSGALVQQDEMPLGSYLSLHPDAVLSAQDKALIQEWATGPAVTAAP